jgi:hypothetical protein
MDEGERTYEYVDELLHAQGEDSLTPSLSPKNAVCGIPSTTPRSKLGVSESSP